MSDKPTYEELQQRVKELESLDVERKLALEALQESKEQVRVIAENFPNGAIVLFDHDLRYLFAGGEIIEKVGLTSEMMVGNTLRNLVTDEYYNALAPYYKAVFSDEKHRFDFKFGGIIHDTSTLPVKDSDGNIIAGMSISQDITERKRAEEAVWKSQEQYRSLFTNMLEGFAYCKIVLDNNGQPCDFVYLEVNDAFEKLTGLKKEDVLNKRVSEAIPGVIESHPELFSTYGKVALTGEGISFEIDFKPLALWLNVSVYSPQREYFVAIFEDITERKKAEIEKSELQTHLNQAQKMEAIGTLAGGIAHDFNNILGVILGYTGMAMEDAGPGSEVAKDLSKVLTSAHRAKELVNQILAFSRQSAVDRIPIQLQPLVKESLKMLRSSIPTTISITEDIHPQCGVVLADPTQIQQVLMNLCTNAYHAMEETGGELAVTLKTKVISPDDQQKHLLLAPGEYVELTVSDTGRGIGPDIIDKIFDPFYTTKEIGKGTGMGLSIIHGIMKDYGGTVTVESQLGKGSTFHTYFPVVEKDAVPETKESEDIPLGTERILFIDDEELLAKMGNDMLERLGYHVTVRRSSFEALETFQNTPDAFDLVITDQTMHGMTGSALARRMMQIRPDIPIILCTGYSNLIDEHSAEALGIKAFALKPLAKGVIAELIRKLLDGKVH